MIRSGYTHTHSHISIVFVFRWSLTQYFYACAKIAPSMDRTDAGRKVTWLICWVRNRLKNQWHAQSNWRPSINNHLAHIFKQRSRKRQNVLQNIIYSIQYTQTHIHIYKHLVQNKMSSMDQFNIIYLHHSHLYNRQLLNILNTAL